MRQERIWRCDCGDDHFLSVTRWPDGPEGYMSLTDGTHCRGLWCRVKSCWKMLRTGNAPHWGVEIVLNPVTAREVITELEAQWKT